MEFGTFKEEITQIKRQIVSAERADVIDHRYHSFISGKNGSFC